MLQVHPKTICFFRDGNLVVSHRDGADIIKTPNRDLLRIIGEFADPQDPQVVIDANRHISNLPTLINGLVDAQVLVDASDLGAVNRLPYDIESVDDGEFEKINAACRNYTMSDVFLNYALYCAVRYVSEHKIPGDIVECGVWKGGSIMLCASVLANRGDTERKIYLYDTFNLTFSEPREEDTTIYGRTGEQTRAMHKKQQERARLMLRGAMMPDAELGVDRIRERLVSLGYPEKNIVFVPGLVEKTIPGTAPEKISLLRLDTDYFDSTYHELVHLYPRLSSRGILLLDDYPTENGFRMATDKYLVESSAGIFLGRVSIQGRIGVKP